MAAKTTLAGLWSKPTHSMNYNLIELQLNEAQVFDQTATLKGPAAMYTSHSQTKQTFAMSLLE